MRLKVYSEHHSFSTSQPKKALYFSFNILKKSSKVFLIFIYKCRRKGGHLISGETRAERQ